MNFNSIQTVSGKSGNITKIGMCLYNNRVTGDQFKCIEKKFVIKDDFNTALKFIRMLENIEPKIGPHLYHIETIGREDYMYMEYIHCSTLHDHMDLLLIKDQDGIDKFENDVNKIKDMMKVLSDNKICHNDFHPGNIVMCPVDGAKVIDLDGMTIVDGKGYPRKCDDISKIIDFLYFTSKNAVTNARSKVLSHQYTIEEARETVADEFVDMGYPNPLEFQPPVHEYQSHHEPYDVDAVYNPEYVPLPIIVSRIDIDDGRDMKTLSNILESLHNMYNLLDADELVCKGVSFTDIVVDKNNVSTITQPDLCHTYDENEGSKRWMEPVLLEVLNSIAQNTHVKSRYLVKIPRKDIVPRDEYEKNVAWIRKSLRDIVDGSTFPGYGDFYKEYKINPSLL